MRKGLIVIVVLAVLGAAGWFIYQRFQAQARITAAPNWEVLDVRRGDISASVSATGDVLPEREANLAFESAGAIRAVDVAVGDRVEAGQVLAQLDTVDVELAIRQAEVGLRTTLAQLRQLQEPPSASDLAAAEAALASAQVAYQDLLAGADADQLASARASVEQARVQLEQAQQAYDQVKDRPEVGLLPQSLQLQQATIAYETAQAQYRVATKNATAAQVAQAQSAIAQAQAGLDRLRKAPSAEQIEIAQASVDQAQITLEQAQNRLADSRIAAPWPGIITTVNAVAGTLAQPAVPAFQIADDSQFHLSVEVDEVDIAGIQPGQPVTIEIDALPDTPLAGQVQSISPAALNTPTGGVAYLVRIDIAPTDAPLRTGMSATATIVSNTRNDVLLIPNRAVQLERETGRTFVERLTADPQAEPQRVEVRLGLRNDVEAEVRDGLEEGDQLAIRTRSGLEQLQQSFGGSQ
jgi:HlyD family secretion protein